MLIYGIIKNHQKRPSPTGHPEERSPETELFQDFTLFYTYRMIPNASLAA